MKNPFAAIHPTLRGFLIIAAIAGIIVAASAESALSVVFLVIRILFLVALVLFVYGLWRNNRHEISMWSTRARVTFYAAAAIMAVDLVAFFFLHASGPNAAIFFVVLLATGAAMWRIWRDERTYV